MNFRCDSIPRRAATGRRQTAFTLIEVMVASAIGSIVLIGVITSYLMIARSSQRLIYYNDMEAGSRRTLEEFAQDVRMSSNSVFNGSTGTTGDSVTLTLPAPNYNSDGNQVTYAYGTVTYNGVTYNNCFYRRPGNTSSSSTPTIFLQNVTRCVFTRYDVLGATTTDDPSTKRIELYLRVSSAGLRSATTLAAASDNIVSATYLLRNKL